MREIKAKEYANYVEDEVSERLYQMLKGLMMYFERRGYVHIPPMVEWSDDMEEDTWEAAEALKFRVIEELERLGLDVQGDGRDF